MAGAGSLPFGGDAPGVRQGTEPVFTLGSLLCGVARDPLMLIVSRSGRA